MIKNYPAPLEARYILRFTIVSEKGVDTVVNAQLYDYEPK